MKKIISILLITLVIMGTFTACSSKDDENRHVHSYSEWTLSDEGVCKREMKCECGYKHIVSIRDEDHPYVNDICSLCGFIEASKVPSFNQATSIIGELLELKEECDKRTNTYRYVLSFKEAVDEDATALTPKYVTYEKVLSDFASRTSLSKAKIDAALVELLTPAVEPVNDASGGDNTETPEPIVPTEDEKLEALKELDTMIVIAEKLIDDKYTATTEDMAEKSANLDAAIATLLNDGKINAAYAEALATYKSNVWAYYEFAKATPNTTPDGDTKLSKTYLDSVNTLKNPLSIAKDSLLDVLQNMYEKNNKK